MAVTSAAYPGRSAGRNRALQNRDLKELSVLDDPGSAARCFTLHRVRENNMLLV
jgi:hypothetical protein